MKLLRYGSIHKERPAVELPDGRRVDVSKAFSDYNEQFFEENGLKRLEKWIKENGAAADEIAGNVRIGSPIARPSKIVCVGLNYSDHAREANMPIPKEPILFFKSTTSLCGPFDDVIIPRKSVKTDWEVELAIIIGKKATYVSEEEALDHVAGYSLMNDVSEREFQLEREGQWVKGKSADTFSPLGPYLVTPDEITDVHDLRLWLEVNGDRLQTGNTKTLVFNVPQVISYISQFMTLLPGDVISTGTPPGVGMGFKPPRYLKPGDIMELGIDGLGSSKQTAVVCVL